MAKPRNIELEKNQVETNSVVFLESYNNSLPPSFPRATIEMLRKFKAKHPMLFKQSNEWSIIRHRKKLMDWLASSSLSEV